MGDFEHDHRAHGGEGAGEVFGPVDDEGRFEEVGGAEADVEGSGAREVSDQGGDDGNVCVELDLSWHVNYDEVFFREGVDGFGEEVEVFEEESGGNAWVVSFWWSGRALIGVRGREERNTLKAVDEPAVRA